MNMHLLRGILIMSCVSMAACSGAPEDSELESGPQEAQQAGAPDQHVCTHDDEFIDVPYQGPSCQLPNGLWRVKLRDGSTVDTRGPDPAHMFHRSGPPASVSSAAALSAFACVPTSGYHGLVIYAVSSDREDRYDTMADTVRGYFQWAQDKLDSEFREFGVSASYKMACNDDGSLRVDNVQLPTPAGNTTFDSIVSDLRAKGYNSDLAQYWVWYDGPMSGICGQGTLRQDDRGDADNENNRGNVFAISYGCDGHVMMHENGHNMGAVQDSAPNSSGAGHCNDGQDVMCYADGGPRSNYKKDVCADHEHLDCNHDDYMHPSPPPDSYLATHWNIGACYNHFIQRSGCEIASDGR